MVDFQTLIGIRRTDAAGQVTEYGYDARNRLQQTTHVGRSVDDQTYSYDFTGKLLSVVEPGKSGAADVAYTYDALHRVITETSSGQTHAYLYDLANNRVKVTYGGTGRVLVSTYDPLHRLDTLEESGRTFSYAYDRHGNIVRKTQPNGDVTTQSFDALNRATSIEGRAPGSPGALLYRSRYRYDLAGNVVFIREDRQETPTALWREITQRYDRAHRLVSEQFRNGGALLTGDGGDRNVSYTYDDADNQVSKETQLLTPIREVNTYNDLNHLVHTETSQPAIPAQSAFSEGIDYAYDLNGNRKSRTTSIVTTHYGYDYDQRLISVEAFEEGLYTYTYDYRTRRVGITNDFGSSFPIGHTVFCFSGGTYVQESKDGTLQAEFIRGSDFGGGIGGLLYSLHGGTPSFTHYNHRGDVVVKTNTSHTVTYRAAYEAYGTRSGESGSTQDRQRANTKDEDITGLLNEGFRYRDLQTGTFLTRDPLGFVDGPNLYTYVRQNPWTKFDPEGLEPNAPYNHPDDAAVQAVKDIKRSNPDKSRTQEFGSRIFRFDKGPNAGKFSYTKPITNDNSETVTIPPAPPGTTGFGNAHNHPTGPYSATFTSADNSEQKDGKVTSGDKPIADNSGQPSYIIYDRVGPRIKKYEPDPGKKGKGQESIYDQTTGKFVPLDKAGPEADTTPYNRHSVDVHKDVPKSNPATPPTPSAKPLQKNEESPKVIPEVKKKPKD